MATNDPAVELLQRVIAAELRAAVARAGLTKEEVAKLSGLSLSTIGRLLSGSRSVDTLQLFKIAKAVDADPGDILDAAQAQYLRKSDASPDA